MARVCRRAARVFWEHISDGGLASLMKWRLLLILCAFFAGDCGLAADRAADQTPALRALPVIELPHVEGRIDHMAFDPRSGRLFVAALGNNSVEVIDTKAGKAVHGIAG